MRILVIGGTRFIGVSVVGELYSKGHEVTIYHRGQTEANHPSEINHIHGDRDDFGKFKGEFQKFSPDVVLDMGLYSETQTRKLLSVVKEFTNRLVAPSSMDVYHSFGLLNGTERGSPQKIPIKEDGELRSNLYPYRGLTEANWAQVYDKILVERTIMNDDKSTEQYSAFPWSTVLFDYQHRVFCRLKPMKYDKRPSILLGQKKASERGPVGYVENIAHGIALAATSENSRKRIYNVCERSLSELEWATAIARAADWKEEIMTAPDDKLPDKLRGTGIDRTVDSSKIRTELGFSEIVSFEEGIKKTVEWESPNQPPKPEEFQLIDYGTEGRLFQELRNEK